MKNKLRLFLRFFDSGVLKITAEVYFSGKRNPNTIRFLSPPFHNRSKSVSLAPRLPNKKVVRVSPASDY